MHLMTDFHRWSYQKRPPCPSSFVDTSSWLDLILTRWSYIYHTFTSTNELFLLWMLLVTWRRVCYIVSHETAKIKIKKTTEILLTSSGHKMQPTEESSAITMKNHSQDISQIWVSLFYPHPITLQAHHLTEVPASHAAFGPGGRL